MYIKIVDEKPVQYSVEQLRKDNPTVSFPQTIPDGMLKEYGVFKLVDGDPPGEYDNEFYKIDETIEQVDGVWYRNWYIVKRPEEHVAMEMKYKRNMLLTESDWMALKDVTLTAARKAYRQALRDITKQSGFPYEIEWPEKPQ